MIIDFEAANETENGWFEIEDGGRVHLRLLSDEDKEEMAKAAFVKFFDYPKLEIDGKEQYKQFVSRDLDPMIWSEMAIDREIVEWEKLFDKNKKPIPCELEFKKKLLVASKKFKQVYDEGIKALEDRAKQKGEELEKNLKSGQSGRPASEDKTAGTA